MPHGTEAIPAKAKKAFRNRMVAAMLAGKPQIDIRSALLLQDAGLIKVEHAHDISAAAQEALNGCSGQRAPLMVYSTPGSQGKQITSTDELLGAQTASIRTSALNAILEVGRTSVPPLLPSTIATLESLRAALGELDGWRRAATDAIDALEEDWCYQLAFLRQAVAIGFDDGIPKYAEQVLRPTLPMIMKLGRDLFPTESYADSPKNRFGSIVATAQTAEEVFTQYVDQLGFMPLGKDMTLAAAFRAWADAHQQVVPGFASLHQWAVKAQSPLFLYQACCAAADNPDILDATSVELFWDTFASVARWWIAEATDAKSAARWVLRSNLIGHFVRFDDMAAPLPVSAEGMCSLAYWQAEHVARIFSDGDELEWAAEKMSPQELQRTSVIWAMGRPLAARSLCRFAAHNTRVLWGPALLGAIERNADRLRLDSTTEKQRGALAEAVITSFVTGFPMPGLQSEHFDFGTLPHELLQKLKCITTEEQRSALEAVHALATVAVSPGDLLRSLTTTSESAYPHLHYAAFRIRMLAYLGELPDEAVWEVVSDPEWRKRVFVDAPPDIVEPVFDALCEMLTHNPGRWRVRFPHLIAETLENGCPDEEKMEGVFGLLVLASLATETVSGLERVLAGSLRNALKPSVERWRSQLRSCLGVCLPWIAGRLRATIAVLRSE